MSVLIVEVQFYICPTYSIVSKIWACILCVLSRITSFYSAFLISFYKAYTHGVGAGGCFYTVDICVDNKSW